MTGLEPAGFVAKSSQISVHCRVTAESLLGRLPGAACSIPGL
ncbi:MAG: hypothetical protein PHE55_18940 [Methylococcaceae bacterium]|nr:hypothetical protein [Methylococcaceae bacterium]